MNARQLNVSNPYQSHDAAGSRLTRAQALPEMVARQDYRQIHLEAPFDGWITAVFPHPRQSGAGG